MKNWLIVIVILSLLTILTAQAEDQTACNIEGFIPLIDPAQLEISMAHSFLNEDSISVGIAAKQPRKIPFRLNSGLGLTWQKINYQGWNAQGLQEGEGEKFLGYYLNLEASSSWKWFYILLKNDVNLKHNFDFSINRFLSGAGFRGKPVSLEVAYSTYDLGRLRSLRFDSVYNEAIVKVGLTPHKVIEIGPQFIWVHYHNQIRKGTYRPHAGIYLKLIRKNSFVEISWARLRHKEKNLQTGRIDLDQDENRVLVKMSYIPSQKLKRGCCR